MPRDLSDKKSTAATGIASPVRESSTIPKAGTDDSTWTYPSPEMFYNALARKNKLEGAREEDMETVVAIHNNMNELTWLQVLAWEALHDLSKRNQGEEPKLLRFMGRPTELSPKAQLKMLFGHTKPFDRHDWIVDRGGKEVRYIIDYYHDESAVAIDEKPKHLKDTSSMKSILVDVRPALDSLESVYDVLFRMPMKQAAGTTTYRPPLFFPQQHAIEAESTQSNELNKKWNSIRENCDHCKETLRNCTTDEECSVASVTLQLCITKIVCPSVAQDFAEAVEGLQSGTIDDQVINQKYISVTKCLEDFKLDSKQKAR